MIDPWNKRAMLLLAVGFWICMHSNAQDVAGQWTGKLNVQGTSLTIVFNIAKKDAGYESTMDSPDQRAQNIPVSNTTFESGILKLSIPAAQIVYSGTLKNDSLTGTFSQGAFQTTLNLVRSAGIVAQARPQEPKKPYPYYSEDVTFPSNDGVVLSGTLTLPDPKGKQPVVVLISGSGPQNRDSEIFGHKTFLVLADYLTRQGIGVLRYDDRGVGKSTGSFQTATTEDFAADAASAVNFLKTKPYVKKNGIGLIGHSEGGIVAPMVAGRSRDVQYIVLLAGSGLPGAELMLLQKKRIEENMGIDAAAVVASQEIFRNVYEKITAPDTTGIKSIVRQALHEAFGTALPDRQLKGIYNQLTSPWMISFLRHNPAPFLKKVIVPVLVLNGDKDLQVPASENVKAIENALRSGGNSDVTVKRYASLNHLFQESQTGALTEYEKIEQTFSPEALSNIADWIKVKNQK